MGKYVYDFDEMNTVKKSLDDIANQELDNISNYNKSTYEELSGWTGEASDSFKLAFGENLMKYDFYVNNVLGLSQYIGDVTKTIEKAEQELSKLKM